VEFSKVVAAGARAVDEGEKDESAKRRHQRQTSLGRRHSTPSLRRQPPPIPQTTRTTIRSLAATKKQTATCRKCC
jgi:hypothetical protein